MKFHLATVNIADSKYTYEDPAFAGFVDNLDRINAIADASPGFVWRYIADDDEAEVKRVFASDTLLFNMSLWVSLEHLRRFAFESDHVDILRQRGKWFSPMDRPSLVLWWQPADGIPSVTEAKHRLECLAQTGPSIDAFTFRTAFDPPTEDTDQDDAA